jgi:cob(I)alamin adenosyltransferase
VGSLLTDRFTLHKDVAMSETSLSERGLVICYTGNGKGKTTAALGMCVRAAGYRLNVAVVQFIKGSWHYGELEWIKLLAPYVELQTAGKGFVGILDDKLPREEHLRAAHEALLIAEEKLASGGFDIVILDEIFVAVGLGLISAEDIIRLITRKAHPTHLVLTGRGAPPEVVEAADLVTEMTEIKHPFQKGIKARRGIDF